MSLHCSDSESENDVAHDELIKKIKSLDLPHRKDKKAQSKQIMKPKTSNKVEINDLLGSIKSTRNLDDLKKKLLPQKSARKEPIKKIDKEKTAEIVKALPQKSQGVIDAPLHRQAKRRIESEIAYRLSKKELSVWNPIVHGYRVAEQICFPLGEDNSIHFTNAEDRAESFEPKTEFERLTAEILGKSKYNIKKNESYSEAERELIKSMSLKEAKKKCAEMQKMRALMSYKAAKLKQQSKIKSKQYHRIKKRQKHRDLIKDIEALMVRDPEKAKEKLGELEKDRAIERGTLKHRAIRWNKHIRQTKNPELRKLMEDHLRLGRELKSRHGLHEEEDSASMKELENCDENSCITKPLTVGEIVKLAVEQADRESSVREESVETHKVNPFYRSALESIRREQKDAVKNAKQHADGEINKTTERKGFQQTRDIEKKRTDMVIQPSTVSMIASIEYQDLVENSAVHQSRRKFHVKYGENSTESKLAVQPFKSTEIVQEDHKPNPCLQNFQNCERPKASEKFLLDEIALDNILDDGKPGVIEQDFLAEAYENDSVLGDFEEEKQRVQDEEKPQAIDLTLHGWGSWTGPGIVDKKKDKFVIQPKLNKRKDAQKPGVLIREKISTAVADFQPRDVPFPFTSVRDFETFIRQPLGASWNTPSAYAKLIQPKIKTKAGRIIKAIDIEEKNRHRVVESDSESE